VNWPELPRGWTLAALPEVAEIIMGQSPPGESYNKDGNGLPFFQGKAEFGLDHPTVRQWCTEPSRIAEPGDVLMSVRAPVGPTNVADQRCAVGRGLAVIRPHEGIPTQLVRTAIAVLEPEIASWGTGTTFTAIGREGLRRIEIPVPPAQSRAFVVDMMSRITVLERRGLYALSGARKQIDEYRQTILSAACMGRLTADWRHAHPDPETVATAIASRGDRRRSPRLAREESIDLPLPSDLPPTYEVVSLHQAAERIEYGTSKPALGSMTTGIPMLRMGNIQDGTLDLDDLKYCDVDDEVRRLLLADGDLLFNRTNSPELVGKSAVFHERGPMTFASYLIRVELDTNVANPDFVNYWINSAWGRAWASLTKTDGVSQSNINGTKLGHMPLPLPPIEEQRVIVERASAMLDATYRTLSHLARAEKMIRGSARALMLRALTGQLESEVAAATA
jgi:type I restriction enzyme S subunit